MMDVKSPKTNTLAEGMIERTSSVSDRRWYRQIFLEISPVQKEALSLHKLQGHAYE